MQNYQNLDKNQLSPVDIESKPIYKDQNTENSSINCDCSALKAFIIRHKYTTYNQYYKQFMILVLQKLQYIVMSRLMIGILSILILGYLMFYQIMSLKRLSPVVIQQNFDFDRYMGQWYEMMRDSKFPIQKGNNGIETYIKSNTEPYHANVKFVELLKDGTKFNADQVMKLVEPSKKEGFLNIKFFLLFPWSWGDYRILFTDYDHLSIVFSQPRILGYVTEPYMWVLTRKPVNEGSQEDQDIRNKVRQIITEKCHGYDYNRLKFTDQSINIANQNK